MLSIFVCDFGFSSAKWLYGDKKGKIPSAFRHGNDKLIIGDDALVLTGSSYIKTMEELVRFYPVFVERCMKTAEVEEKEVELVVGLPYTYWEEHNRQGGAVPMLEKSLTTGVIKNVTVLPQGLGGIKSFIGSTEGADTKADDKNILAIDIGFNTIIFNVYSPLTKQIIFGQTLNKRGVYQMATELLLPKIRSLAPSASFTAVEISCLIESGIIQYGFEQFDISREIRESAEIYIKNILTDIAGHIKGHFGSSPKVGKVLVFGGGAELMKSVATGDENVEMIILPDPVYANARGFAAAVLGASQ